MPFARVGAVIVLRIVLVLAIVAAAIGLIAWCIHYIDPQISPSLLAIIVLVLAALALVLLVLFGTAIMLGVVLVLTAGTAVTGLETWFIHYTAPQVPRLLIAAVVGGAVLLSIAGGLLSVGWDLLKSRLTPARAKFYATIFLVGVPCVVVAGVTVGGGLDDPSWSLGLCLVLFMIAWAVFCYWLATSPRLSAFDAWVSRKTGFW